jgi:hypothetical protein
MRPRLPVTFALLALGLAGCRRAARYQTEAELVRVHAFGRDARDPGLMDVELRYAACPGEAHEMLRGGRAFAACARRFQPGDRVTAEVLHTYDPERGVYRSEVTRLGGCEVTPDPKDEANYEVVESCSDLKASGAVVGVVCNRRRDQALLDRCPWLRRN